MTGAAATRPAGVGDLVRDRSTSVPVLRHPRPEEVHGRGIALVDELPSSGATPRRTGPAPGGTVWAEITIPVKDITP
ncbi:hypothetical protein ACWD5V_02585 [Streptomyces sp. NPDC002523]